MDVRNIVLPPCWESSGETQGRSLALSLLPAAFSKEHLGWSDSESEDGSPTEKDGVHAFHHPGSPRYLHPSMWCVTLRDLDNFESEVRSLWKAGGIPDDPEHPSQFHNDPKIGPSIYVVNKHYIRPETLRQGGMSWALMKHPKGLKCDVFATHCWSEGVFEFISKVRMSWPPGARHLWACFLALPQNGNIGAILQGDILQSPFAKALTRAKYVLVIPNKTQSIYLRLWCVYEAFLSLQLVAKKNLVISLPSAAPHWEVLRSLVPGFCLWLAGAVTSYRLWAPKHSDLLPPLLWLLTAVFSSLVVVEFCKMMIRIVRRLLGQSAKLGKRQEIVVGWLALMVMGVGVGFVQHGLRHHSHTSKWQWEPGEGWACGFLTANVLLMHTSSIVRAIAAAVRRAEGVQLDFRTVRDATCTDEGDEARIRQAIKGHEENIDHAIRALRVIGRFNRATHQNMQYGLSPQRVRDGLALFKVTTACCAWSYWWVTDLVATGHQFWATGSSLLSCVVALSAQWLIGEQSIFAMDTLFYFGSVYIVASLVFARFLWGNLPLNEKRMSYDCIPLQAACFVMMCLTNLWFYRGGYARACASWGAAVAGRCYAGDAEHPVAWHSQTDEAIRSATSPEVWALVPGHDQLSSSSSSTSGSGWGSDTSDGEGETDESVSFGAGERSAA